MLKARVFLRTKGLSSARVYTAQTIDFVKFFFVSVKEVFFQSQKGSHSFLTARNLHSYPIAKLKNTYSCNPLFIEDEILVSSRKGNKINFFVICMHKLLISWGSVGAAFKFCFRWTFPLKWIAYVHMPHDFRAFELIQLFHVFWVYYFSIFIKIMKGRIK